MEDGPEAAESHYEYNGRTVRLVEQESEQWKVYDAGVHIGTVLAVPGLEDGGPEYTIDLAGEDGAYDEPSTDDWRRAVETLIDLANP
jgi:hypothetical protein